MWKTILKSYHRTPFIFRFCLLTLSVLSIGVSQYGSYPVIRTVAMGLGSLGVVSISFFELVEVYERIIGNGAEIQLAGWTQINPAPPPEILSEFGTANLNNVKVLNSYQIFAVGDNGLIVKSTDFGARWNLQQSGTKRNLHGISFINTNEGIVVGDEGIILQTSDGGNTWFDITPSQLWSFRDISASDQDFDGDGIADGNYLEVLPNRDICLYTVHHITPRDIVAVGNLGINRSFAIRTKDRGQTWQDISEWSVYTLNDVEFANASKGVAVGGGLNVVSARRNEIWYTDNGGSTRESWTRLDYPEIVNGSRLNTVSYADEDTVFAFGKYDYYLKSITGGASWTREPRLIGDCSSTNIYDSDFPDVNTGYVVGDYGTVLATNDGALAWEQKPRQTRLTIPAVSFVDTQQGAIVGPGFTALTTKDGGSTWSGHVTQTLRNLRSISFSDDQSGMAVGDWGDVFLTSDGGASWAPLNPGEACRGIQFPFYGIDMIDPSTAVVVGNGGDWIFRTNDGGLTWVKQTYSGIVSYLNSVSFLDTQIGTAVGYPAVIIYTADGGATWQPVENPTASTMQSVHVVSSSLAAAVGDDATILRSTDGGMTWSKVSRDAILATGNIQLRDVYFANETTGWAVGWEWEIASHLSVKGVILKTRDGGISWYEQNSRTGLRLHGVHFSNATTGSIVGDRGTILRTVDGVTWYEQVAPRNENLYGVSLSTNFNGVIVGDSGTILRTVNGGSL